MTHLYSEFSKLMRENLEDQYYQPPLDTLYYTPIVHRPEVIKYKTEWLREFSRRDKHVTGFSESVKSHSCRTRASALYDYVFIRDEEIFPSKVEGKDDISAEPHGGRHP
jgi:hypothetical protein